MSIAIVTGASSGMGREFVLALDRQQEYDEIWAIARRGERLAQLQEECRARIRPLTLDLQQMDSLDRLKELLEERKPQVQTLVNGAGYGLFGRFMDMELKDQLSIIDLNSRALAGVTYLTVPYMPQGGRIYNLGSLSSFQPVPLMSIYAASKAFVLSFSRALGVELQPRGLRVMAVCPGWVKTEFLDRAVRDDTVSYFCRYYTARQVVVRALRDMARGKAVSTLGFPERLQVWLVKHLPTAMVLNTWMKQQKQK